jgi:hypothetical protein
MALAIFCPAILDAFGQGKETCVRWFRFLPLVPASARAWSCLLVRAKGDIAEIGSAFNLVQQNRCSCVAENLDLSIRHHNHQRHPSLTFHLDVLPICSCGCLLLMIN